MSRAALYEWRKCFELQDGRPTGRWQWVIESCDGDYYFPGRWLSSDAIVVLPEARPEATGVLRQ